MNLFGCEGEVRMRDWSGGVLCLPGDLRAGFDGGSRMREGGGRDGMEGMAVKSWRRSQWDPDWETRR